MLYRQRHGLAAPLPVGNAAKVKRMPLYDYSCKKCDHTFELLVRASTVPACPRCGGSDLDKLMSAPAPPGKSAAIATAGRARAAQAGHLGHYRRVNGKVVD